MALVQPLVIQQQQKESALDKVLKGVQLANGVLSTYEGARTMGDKVKAASLQKEALADKRGGVFYASDIDPTKTEISETEIPGGTQIQLRENDAIKRVYVKSRPQTLSPYESETLNLKRQELNAKESETTQPTKILSKLGGEEKNKVGAIASGFRALDMMTDAVQNKGQGPKRIDPSTSVVGGMVSDNEYFRGERTLAEVVGRLQSGGAMSKDEIATFKSMGPRAGDDPSVIPQKINDQKVFLENKLRAYGLSEGDLQEAGFATRGLKEAITESKKPASQPIKLSAEDEQALNWAKSNSKDPRAEKILNRLGAK